MTKEAAIALNALEERCRQLLGDIASFRLTIVGKHCSRMEQIVSAVEGVWRVPMGSVMDKTRVRPVAEARIAAYYIAVQLSGMNYSEVGRQMKKDHGTIISGVRRAQQLIEIDRGFRALVQKATEEVSNG